MPYTLDGKNAMLEHLRSQILRASLHGAKPPSNRVSEAQLVSFLKPTDGLLKLAEDAAFLVPAGSSVKFAGFWNASDVLLAWGKVPAASFKSDGVYVIEGASMDLNLGEE